jgi:hypothetical protein
MNAILENIKPETAERLAAQARALGVSVDEYLRSILPNEIGQAENGTLSSKERAKLWREWVENHSVSGVIADDSRESIYSEREDHQY